MHLTQNYSIHNQGGTMADIKTHLRELSVATTVGLLKNNCDFNDNDMFTPDIFWTYANDVISSDISSAQNIIIEKTFTRELKDIILNGIKLGKSIYSSPEFIIDANDTIIWEGSNTQKDDPIDIRIGKYAFSLKEESFILENMGLYKLLNCYTGSTYKRRHIFSDYARTEYSNWFSATWGEMITYLHSNNSTWRYSDTKKQKDSVITIDGNSVVLEYLEKGKSVSKAILPIACSLSTFEKNTNAKSREQVFSRFIHKELDSNSTYNVAKKTCAITATEALVKELNDNLNYNAGLPRFLRIHDFEYYYAKTTSSDVHIYKVPALKDFQNNIVIESIEASVPDKQANILTTIKNIKTGKTLTLRNECRFSHGQFNGTPEAKMYYEHGGSLLVIYEPIL